MTSSSKQNHCLRRNKGRSLLTIILFALPFMGSTSSFTDLSCKMAIDESVEIQIRWVDDLAGDFSFIDNWSYRDGVYRNEFGQMSCDGLCPPEIETMFDENRKILADSLEAFYNLVDTTHYFHSIESEAMTYEWAGTEFISVNRVNKDTVICFTMNNVATHSSLDLVITEKTVKPTIDLISITPSGNMLFYCSGGEMTIDRSFWEKGILKATFDFKFDDKENPDMQMYWKGKIYAEIKSF